MGIGIGGFAVASHGGLGTCEAPSSGSDLGVLKASHHMYPEPNVAIYFIVTRG